MKRRVVVTGLGVVTSLGRKVDTFWERVVRGDSGVGPITLFDVSGYRVQFGGQVPWEPEGEGIASPKELRRLDRHRKIDMTVASLAVAGSEDDPGAALARRQEVGDAMAGLSADDRLILGLRWWAELTEAEMADVLAVARGTVKSRLSRAMTRLRAELEEEAADA